MAFDEKNLDPRQNGSNRKITRELANDGTLKHILIESSMGIRKNTFDADGHLAERYVQYANGHWKLTMYKNGIKFVCREYDGVSVSTLVFDRRGRLAAASEDAVE